MSLYDRAHFAIISLVHEILYGPFVDPYPLLRDAGLVQGMRVLEVGCGPGYFTVPAARIVAETGHLVAIDNNPFAIRRVKREVEKEALTNVEVTFTDAGRTGLPDSNFDVVFLFGVVHALDPGVVIPEMHRILKAGGRMSVESHGSSQAKFAEAATKEGLFREIPKTGRVHGFERNP